MQWSINLTERSNIEFIKAYAQLQSNKKTQIVSWDVGKPVVSSDGEKNYGNRPITYLNNSKFTLTITNVQYNDSRNYSMSVISKPPLTEAADTVTVYVYGMFFCYFKRLIFSESCLKMKRRKEIASVLSRLLILRSRVFMIARMHLFKRKR